MLLGGVALAAVACCCASRSPTCIVVPEEWAAAAVIPPACLWLLLSVERGALQGLQRYRPVAWSIVPRPRAARVGLVLVAAGLGVTGAFLGTLLSLLATAARAAGDLARAARRPGARRARRERLRELVGGAWSPSLGLSLLALAAERGRDPGQAPGRRRRGQLVRRGGRAAKGIIWIALGLGLYLLPEGRAPHATGRTRGRCWCGRWRSWRMVAVPMVLLYAVRPRAVLRLAFGPD